MKRLTLEAFKAPKTKEEQNINLLLQQVLGNCHDKAPSLKPKQAGMVSESDTLIIP